MGIPRFSLQKMMMPVSYIFFFLQMSLLFLQNHENIFFSLSLSLGASAPIPNSGRYTGVKKKFYRYFKTFFIFHDQDNNNNSKYNNTDTLNLKKIQYKSFHVTVVVVVVVYFCRRIDHRCNRSILDPREEQ